MVRSMTGYGRASGNTCLGEIRVEIRGVNSKHLDLRLRTPRQLFVLEPYLNKELRSTLARGRVECSLVLATSGDQSTQLKVNQSLARSYLEASKELGSLFNLDGGLSTEFLLRIPEVVGLEDPEIEPDAVWAEVRPIVREALDAFCSMRKVEGEQLRQEFLARLDEVQGLVRQVDEERKKVIPQFQERLRARIEELCADIAVDESRLAQEVALLAERTDITEEVVRLKSHLEQFKELVSGDDTSGRKLDFILQEMFREVNTIGAKADPLSIKRLVLEMKNEIEKLREQTQNVE